MTNKSVNDWSITNYFKLKLVLLFHDPIIKPLIVTGSIGAKKILEEIKNIKIFQEIDHYIRDQNKDTKNKPLFEKRRDNKWYYIPINQKVLAHEVVAFLIAKKILCDKLKIITELEEFFFKNSIKYRHMKFCDHSSSNLMRITSEVLYKKYDKKLFIFKYFINLFSGYIIKENICTNISKEEFKNNVKEFYKDLEKYVKNMLIIFSKYLKIVN